MSHTIQFYKGESMSIVFKAYDNATPTKPMDVSGYHKEVLLFTPFSSRILKSVVSLSNNSFRVDISGNETNSLTPGHFNIVLKLTKNDEVKIGKSIPCILLDPDTINCKENERLSIDEGVIHVEMGIDTNSVNFEIYFGNTVTSPIIRTDEFRRRIAFVAEREEMLIPVGEDMVLYKAKARNVKSLSIKPASSSVSTWQNVPLNADISIEISAGYDLLARIEKAFFDAESTVYLFTKVIEEV